MILKKGEQLIRKYLKELRNRGILDYTHPKIPNHPSQAYRVTDFGKKWWKNENEDAEVNQSCRQETSSLKQI